MDYNNVAIDNGDVEILMDFDTVPQLHPVIKQEVAMLTETAQETNSKKYKKYGQEQIKRFIQAVQEEGLTVPKAAEQCGIPRSTGYRLIDEFNARNGIVLPGGHSKTS
ncbi:hypothetical protein BDB01DRAFT_796786 [Pilobolus umbonatus]|nr:hypothetical protein BDB01DRAFT_796786 [Pilobolus umbonatus]